MVTLTTYLQARMKAKVISVVLLSYVNASDTGFNKKQSFMSEKDILHY